jgi:hypothetical protein
MRGGGKARSPPYARGRPAPPKARIHRLIFKDRIVRRCGMFKAAAPSEQATARGQKAARGRRWRFVRSAGRAWAGKEIGLGRTRRRSVVIAFGLQEQGGRGNEGKGLSISMCRGARAGREDDLHEQEGVGRGGRDGAEGDGREDGHTEGRGEGKGRSCGHLETASVVVL